MRCLALYSEVEAVEGAELGQGSQVHVEEAVGRKSEVRKLQDAKEFEADDFAAEDGQNEDGVADDLGGL